MVFIGFWFVGKDKVGDIVVKFINVLLGFV